MRRYDVTTAPSACVELYRDQRRHQTLARAVELRDRYCGGGNLRATVWDALQLLRRVEDRSDPDIALPNDAHALQTAAMMARDGLPDAMVAMGLIHDLGKIMLTWGCDADGTSPAKQWATVGDTFVAGHPLPDALPFAAEFNGEHASADAGYAPGCGLDNVVFSFGHDEYLYRALLRNAARHTLPPECLRIVRLHSLYAWHTHGCYTELEDAADRELKPKVQAFQRYDLYSKDNTLTESWADPKWRALVERVFGTDEWDW